MTGTITYTLPSKAWARRISRRLRDFSFLSEVVPQKAGALLIVHVTKHGPDVARAAFIRVRNEFNL